MTQKIRFTKMHGAGNDYIYIEDNLRTPSNSHMEGEDKKSPLKGDLEGLARLLSDRHTGIGSDGLVLIGRSPMPEADFTMRIFNADGSEAMMCGNASRCIGKYLYEKGLTNKTEIRLLTLSGVKVLSLTLDPSPKGEGYFKGEGKRIIKSVTVDMGEPVFEDENLYQPLPSLESGMFVSMGNPHYVIFVGDAELSDVTSRGSRLEHHAAFPQRCNIEFAEMRPDGIRVRVWERGSGITMACGTGACATAVAACKQGKAGRKSRIIMDGGTLEIEWREADNHVYLSGPAEFVFEGEIELSEQSKYSEHSGNND